ncbi:hypothetical protein TNCV_306691 [Trichonephila clavipes]|nr:hypothetical protein TNCV_306691 [Trichonephila clavipes]
MEERFTFHFPVTSSVIETRRKREKTWRFGGCGVEALAAIKDCFMEGAGSPREVPSAKRTRKTAKSAESVFWTCELSRTGGECVMEATHLNSNARRKKDLLKNDYTRAFGDGPRNFEPWSSDVDDTLAGTPSPNSHTTPTGGRFSSRQI